MSSSVIDAFKSLKIAAAQDAAEHEAVFEVSYQYLAKIKNFQDLPAFHNCLVALINTDKYHKALEFLREVPEDVRAEYPLEVAYVYYKTGHTAQLQQVYRAAVESGDVNDVLVRALKHVMAQSYYQSGQMAQALLLYRDLISSNTLDNDLDMACNERAILSQLAWSGHRSEPLQTVPDAQKTYDIVFNEALIALAANDVPASLRMLEQAAAMCTEQNMDLDPADLALEIAPMKLATAYIYAHTGRLAQAERLLQDLDMALITDLMTQLLFKTNYTALTFAGANVNYIARELDYQRNLHHLRLKLTKRQSQVLLKNHLLLSYQGNTIAKSSTYLTNGFYAAFSADYAGDVTPLLYRILVKLDISLADLESAELQRAVSRKLLRFASAELEAHGASDLAIAAALLLVTANSKLAKYDQSFLVLEKLAALELAAAPEKLHASVFGLLIHLYEHSSNAKKLAELYDALVAKLALLTTQQLQENPHLYDFVRAVAFKLASADANADVLFKALGAADSQDAVVASVLSGDRSRLRAKEELASQEDVEVLLAVDVKQLAPAPAAASKPRVAEHKVTKKKAHKPQFSKSKTLKADFDAKDLDQERWLPMKLRSYYKPSKKELKKRGGGHQGAVEASPAPSAPSTSASASKNKKKKKKGKK